MLTSEATCSGVHSSRSACTGELQSQLMVTLTAQTTLRDTLHPTAFRQGSSSTAPGMQGTQL